jgi:hypothetical protein
MWATGRLKIWVAKLPNSAGSETQFLNISTFHANIGSFPQMKVK